MAGMENASRIYIRGTSKTPEIDFAPGTIQIAGRSIPEDTVAFFEPLVNWIENYLKSPEELTKVIFRIEYINSGSNRFIYRVLKLLDESFVRGHNVHISWFYEEDDDTIKSLGKDLQTFFTIPVNLVEIT